MFRIQAKACLLFVLCCLVLDLKINHFLKCGGFFCYALLTVAQPWAEILSLLNVILFVGTTARTRLTRVDSVRWCFPTYWSCVTPS